jgi:hypothetical protein
MQGDCPERALSAITSFHFRHSSELHVPATVDPDAKEVRNVPGTEAGSLEELLDFWEASLHSQRV